MLAGLSGLRVERWHDEAVRRRGEGPGQRCKFGKVSRASRTRFRAPNGRSPLPPLRLLSFFSIFTCLRLATMGPTTSKKVRALQASISSKNKHKKWLEHSQTLIVLSLLLNILSAVGPSQTQPLQVLSSWLPPSCCSVRIWISWAEFSVLHFACLGGFGGCLDFCCLVLVSLLFGLTAFPRNLCFKEVAVKRASIWHVCKFG